ncbi:hypothetical protein L195_g063117, partial [Trifolium pratense]
SSDISKNGVFFCFLARNDADDVAASGKASFASEFL